MDNNIPTHKSVMMNEVLEILNPKNTWKKKEAYDLKANELANAFNKNFQQFADNANKDILDAAPKIK